MTAFYEMGRAGLAAFALAATSLQAGELVYGPDARSDFEELRDVAGDHYIDFDNPNRGAGPISAIPFEGVTISFVTTQVRWPEVVNVNYPVSVIPFNYVTTTHNGTQTLMGTSHPSGIPDGQSRYEIRFSEPQARVGLMRLWNTWSLTRFYNPQGELLAEHQNTEANEFVGWRAMGPETDQWVQKVEIDGQYISNAFQVGEVDEIFFGTGEPPDEGDMIGLVHGSEDRTLFEDYATLLDDTLVDFESVTADSLTTLTVNGVELTFRTTLKRWPSIVPVDYPVAVLPRSGVPSQTGTRELMGAGSPSGSPDGQSRYEVTFSEPQHRVGLDRNWNTSTLTRFYAEDGTILDEYQNQVNRDFVGWVGNPRDESTWVKTVEFDGLNDGQAYQVGTVDNLRFGSNLPIMEDPVVHSVTISHDGQVHIEWQPAQVNHAMQYSHDMLNWSMAEGELHDTSWTGQMEGDPVRIYFRVLTEKLFPD